MSLRFLQLNAAAFLLATFLFNSAASAQELQVDADLGFRGAFGMAQPAIEAGILLSERLVIETGFAFYVQLDMPDSGYFQRGFQLPLEVAWYFGEAKPDTFVPSVRASTGYGQFTQVFRYSDGDQIRSEELTTHSVRAGLLGGVTYFVSEHFGISAQGGPIYTRSYGPKSQLGLSGGPKHTIGSEYRVGLTFRT